MTLLVTYPFDILIPLPLREEIENYIIVSELIYIVGSLLLVIIVFP